MKEDPAKWFAREYRGLMRRPSLLQRIRGWWRRRQWEREFRERTAKQARTGQLYFVPPVTVHPGDKIEVDKRTIGQKPKVYIVRRNGYRVDVTDRARFRVDG